MHWKKVTLVGVGLLGGSFGQALKQRRLAGSVVGYVRRPASIAECARAKAVDFATCDIEAAVKGADLVVLCTPIAQMKALFAQIGPLLNKGAIVTDVGSVKDTVVRDLEPLARKFAVHFIGSHPMAGAEKMGVLAARPDLFEEAVCVVTTTLKSNPKAAARVKALWKAVGCRVMTLTPKAHDRFVALSSHLPHLVAAHVAELVLDPALAKEVGMLCANGFRDTTRVASGSPEMWRDIALANHRNLTTALRRFINALERTRRLLERGEGDRVMKFLERAKAQRDQWSSVAASSSTE